MHAGEGRQMLAPAAPFPDDRQGQSVKLFQQALSRGAGCRPRRVAGIQPGQPRVGADVRTHLTKSLLS